MSRDPVAEIVAYNLPLAGDDRRVKAEDGRDLSKEALGRKLEALAKSPFSFFRGTFHLMADDVGERRVPAAERRAPDAWIVGDLHLENFGVYRGADGDLVFDVNDFDDVGRGPADLDLQRLCTSAFLLPGVSASAREAAARAAARGWAEAVARLGGRYPVGPWDESKAEEPVKALLAGQRQRTRAEQVAKVAPEKGHKRFSEEGAPPRFAHVGKAWEAVVHRALAEYRHALDQLKVDVSHTWEVLDVAYRFKGNGSLGRLRFAALLGRGDERRLVEIKEARGSVLGFGRHPARSPNRARAQTAAIRRLQGDPWPRVAGTTLGKLPALAREVQAEEVKLGTDKFAAAGRGAPEQDTAALVSYARQCGEVAARLLCRGSAPDLLDDPGFDAKACAEAALVFAERYAPVVESDHRGFVKHKAEVASALGLG